MRLADHLRIYKEALLPQGSAPRRYYDQVRSRLRADARAAENLGAQDQVVENFVAERAGPEGTVLPLPPANLCMRVGGTDGGEFLSQGSFLQQCLIHSLPADYSWRGKRVFDFGCGVGRVLRHFAHEAHEAEFWGSDIHEPSVSWLARSMGRDFRIIKTDTEPKLPFPSNYFDLIYCVSVFTHVHKEWDAWLEEIRRVLAPEGQFLCTFHSRVAYEWIMHRRFDENSIGMKIYFKNRPWDLGGPQIFHSDSWVVRNWGKILPINAIIREGLVNWQSIAVMQKRTSSAKEQVRFLQPFPYSRSNPDFSGNLDYDPLAPRSWLREHGLIYEGTAEVGGWFSSAAGPIEQIRFLVDGQLIDPQALEKNVGVAEHTGHPNLSFKAVLDLSASSEGAHEAKVIATDNAGRENSIEFMLFRRNQSKGPNR